METEKERDGFDRRQFLRRAAVAGAAAAWAAPVVKTVVGTPAFAKNVTGSPKDLSYVVVFYTCDDGVTTCAVKWDLDTDVAEAGNFATPDCGAGVSGLCGTPGDFVPPGDGSAVTVCLTQEAFDRGCRITDGFAKAGSSQSTPNPCGPATSNDGRCISFIGVGL
jgi:hypothetical protein